MQLPLALLYLVREKKRRRSIFLIFHSNRIFIEYNVTFLFYFFFSKGWKQNTHYTYEYNGRVATAIKELKQQWALVHVTGIVNVQCHEAEDTLIVKVQYIMLMLFFAHTLPLELLHCFSFSLYNVLHSIFKKSIIDFLFPCPPLNVTCSFFFLVL